MPLRRATRSAVLVLALAAVSLAGGSTDPTNGDSQAGRRWRDLPRAAGPGPAPAILRAGVAALDREGRRWR